MAITSFDQYIASVKDAIGYIKTASAVTIGAAWFTLIDLAGNPGAGVLAAGNTANGQVPDRLTAGYPTLKDFAVGMKGYLSRVNFSNSVASRLKLIDRLFHCGAYNFNDDIILVAQPDFSARVPNASYKDLSIWMEAVTALVGASYNVTVLYTNENGVTGRSTGAFTVGALTIRRAIQLPLQAGDRGVQKIERVTVAGGSSGTINIFIARELWNGRVVFAGMGDTHALDKTGLIEVPQNAALQLLVSADSTSSGIPEFTAEITQS